jgi:hypothetical protein
MQGNAQTHVDVAVGIESGLYATTQNGTMRDRQGFHEALVIVNCGAAAGDGSVVVKIQHGAASDGTGAADITGAAFAALTTSTDHARYVGRIKLSGANRYVRAVGTYSGSGASNEVNYSVEFVFLSAHDTARTDGMAAYVFNVTNV